MSDLEDAIEALTLGEVTIGSASTDKITSAQLTLLETLTSSTVSRMNPGFTGYDLILFKARIILDLYSNSPGSGQITEKTVKDTRWKVAQSKSSSVWMDQAMRQISDYRESVSRNLVPSGVARSDAQMKGFDNTTIKQYGSPSDAL